MQTVKPIHVDVLPKYGIVSVNGKFESIDNHINKQNEKSTIGTYGATQHFGKCAN